MAMDVPHELTPARVAAIAAALRADDRLTVAAACIDVGVAPGAVQQALFRLRSGTGGTHVLEIARAVDHQCEVLLSMGDEKADNDKPTSWYQWRLETKHPTQYGRKQSVDVSGQLDTSALQTKTDAELLAIITAEDE